MYVSLSNLTKVLILSLFALSCQNPNNKEEKQLLTFDLSKLPEISTVKLSDLGFKDIEYIPFETNDSSFIEGNFGPISENRILSANDFFIITRFTRILKFGDDGSFMRKIGIKGRGPGEFQVCSDVEVDDFGKIYIIDASKDLFFVYSENGDLIKTFKSPLVHRPVKFIYFDGNFLCYNKNNLSDIENSFNVIDTNGTLNKSFYNRYPFKKNPSHAYTFNHENIFYRFNNHIFKKEIYCDTIFSFENMCFKPHMVIHVGDKLITPEIRSKIEESDIMKNYIDPLKLFEFGDYIFYEFKVTEFYSFIASKKDDFQALIDSEKGLINDLDGGPNIIPITTRGDNKIIAMIEALELKNYVASDSFRNSAPKYPEKKKKLEILANSLKETDNPVLIMVRLKN